MTISRFDRYSVLAALSIGVLSFGFAPAVTASSSYEAMAEFTLSLTDVTHLDGTTVMDGWQMIASGGGDVFLTEFGDASASGSVIVIDPPVVLDIGDTISQASTISGTAGNGFVSSDALTDLTIMIENFTSQALRFSMDYTAIANASYTGRGSATAAVDMWEENGLVDLSVFAVARSWNGPGVAGAGTVTSHNPFGLLLQSGEQIEMSVLVDTLGNTPLIVPVPAAVWLFGTGLFCLAGLAARRRKTL